jgi:glycosyltransferase involved in cell wall biosynthesis
VMTPKWVEAFGNVAVEAMACGVPVIAYRRGGPAEIVVDGETGFLVEPGDVAALRMRLTDVLADPARAGAMGDAARARAVARFTWDECARRCLDAYRELV